MLTFAAYKGKTFWPSKCIEWLTRSPYSHIAIRFDEPFHFIGCASVPAMDVPAGSVIEAWDGGVRLVKSLSDQHDVGTEVDLFKFKTTLTHGEFRMMATFLCSQLGKGYSWTNVLRFVTKHKGSCDGSEWFCSELAFAAADYGGRRLFNQTEAWQVPPDWIPRSPRLIYAGTTRTT